MKKEKIYLAITKGPSMCCFILSPKITYKSHKVQKRFCEASKLL